MELVNKASFAYKQTYFLNTTSDIKIYKKIQFDVFLTHFIHM